MESCTCAGGVKMVEYIKNQKTMKFLMGLNEGYDTLRSNIVAIDPLPAVNKAYAMALRHDKQAAATLGNKSVVQPEGALFAMKNSGDGETSSDDGKRCTKCNKKYHTAQNCRAHLKCSYCNWKGHDYEHCRKRKAADESRSNNVISGIEGTTGAPSFPFSQEVCRQLIEMLGKSAAASTNHTGNTPSHQNLSGPTIGEDDWDGP